MTPSPIPGHGPWGEDGWVRVLRPFNSISVISRRKGEHERLCAMKRRLDSGRISPPAGFEPATRELKSGALTTRPRGHFPEVRSHGKKPDPPGYLWSKYECFLMSGWWDILRSSCLHVKLWSNSTNRTEVRMNEQTNEHTNGKTKTIYPLA